MQVPTTNVVEGFPTPVGKVKVVRGRYPAMMAKKRSRKFVWTKSHRRVAVMNEGALGAMAANVAIASSLVVASDNEYRAISLRASWSLAHGTAGEGPLSFGLNHGDYSAAEVEEWIENQASIQRGDMIAAEVAGRKIRRIGQFSGALTDEVWNDGKPVTTRLNWNIPVGDVLDFWVYNHSAATLTSGAAVVCMGGLLIKYT